MEPILTTLQFAIIVLKFVYEKLRERLFGQGNL
jgi:hypothetical protein